MRAKNIIVVILFLYSSYVNAQSWLEKLETVAKGAAYINADMKSNNSLSRLTGKWTKYKIQYPNGRKELIPYNERVSVSIIPDLNNQTLMSYQFYKPGESIAWEEGLVWFTSSSTICFGIKYDPNNTGLTFKFGTDERGMECLMIKALLFSQEEVWLIYKRDL